MWLEKTRQMKEVRFSLIFHYYTLGRIWFQTAFLSLCQKNQNDDNDYLRLFSIVFFAVESDSGVKWSLKLVQGPKKEDLEA